MSHPTPIPTLRGNLILRGKIETLTGLHVGGSKEKMQIGGVDLVVIRSASTNQPYIPGSTLKGKMRHLLEYVTGGVNQPFKGLLGNVSVLAEIVRLFGIGAEVTELAHDTETLEGEISKTDDEAAKDYLKYIRDNLKGVGLPRLIFRDAYLAPESEPSADATEAEQLVEIKAENNIDRLTSAANPRFQERVAEGTLFDFEIVYTAYDEDDAKIEADIRALFAGLRLLENSFIGKGGTRGSGKIKFHVAPPLWISKADYLGKDSDQTSARFAAYEKTYTKADLGPLPHTANEYFPKDA